MQTVQGSPKGEGEMKTRQIGRWLAEVAAAMGLCLAVVACYAAGIFDGLVCWAGLFAAIVLLLGIHVGIDEYLQTSSGLRAIGAAVAVVVCINGAILIGTSQVPQLYRFMVGLAMAELGILCFAGLAAMGLVVAGKCRNEE